VIDSDWNSDEFADLKDDSLLLWQIAFQHAQQAEALETAA
jgi:hypothetical protein